MRDPLLKNGFAALGGSRVKERCKMGKIIITGWSSILKCKVCGSEQLSRTYQDWNIGSSTISRCPTCDRVTNHHVVAHMAETMSYEDYLLRLDTELVTGQE